MKCPNCKTGIHDTKNIVYNQNMDNFKRWALTSQYCPECKQLIIKFCYSYLMNKGSFATWEIEDRSQIIIYPKTINIPDIPIEVPDDYKKDFIEATLVLEYSPKASAALSRRLLQKLLREKAGVKSSDLSKEIQEVLDSNKLPSQIAESIDAIRNIGNFAAHPNKSLSSREIIEVEPGEAEWTLEVIESLFDHYIVQPEKIKIKKADLNKKLHDAGKQPMK